VTRMKLNLIAKTTLSLTAIALSVISAPIAQSTTLSGHLEQLQPATIGGAVRKIGLSRTDCFPEGYAGSWQCETVVTDSAVGTVLPGQKVLSEVEFMRDQSGAIVSSWKQDGWQDGQSSVTAFNTTEAQMDRTSYYVAGSNDAMWAARARGQFTQVTPFTIVGKTVVDQYIDGQYVGRYHTTSILHRERPDTSVAAIEMREPNDNVGPAYAAPAYQYLPNTGR
jgi:hypothetical protein